MAGTWSCTELQCTARCEALGDPHYITFDRKYYDFMGKCSYYLLQHSNYSVAAENVPCDGSISEVLFKCFTLFLISFNSEQASIILFVCLFSFFQK